VITRKKTTRILIVDDHPLVREGMKRVLEDAVEEFVFDEAGNSAESHQKILDNDYDLVICGLIPERVGLKGLKVIRQLNHSLPILLVSAYSEDNYGVRALRAGASGYVSKTSAIEEFYRAVRTVLDGNKYISPALAEKLARGLGEPLDEKPHESLSAREFEILLQIARGKRLKEIAHELSLSIKTVSTYRSRVLEKMDVESNAQLIRYALENGLLD
jgi:DNA-binding NarL/FixJ family response regulator